VEAVSELVQAHGGSVAGASWFLTRTPDLPATLPAPNQAVVTLPLPAWDQHGCQRCADGTTAEDALDLN
jgi:hypothetical protein